MKLATKSGETIQGVIKNENNFSIQVMDRSYQIHLLNRDEVAQIEYGTESLMPHNYGQILSSGEIQDLLAFLSRQVRQ